MKECKRCNSKEIRKSGFVRGSQRYKCKECGYNFVDKPGNGKPKLYKILAVLLYSTGKASYRYIGKLLKVSATAVYDWIKEFGKLIPEERESLDLKEVEFDEMWHYVGSKKTKDGFGKLMIDLAKEQSPGLSVIVIPRHLGDFGKKSSQRNVCIIQTTGNVTKKSYQQDSTR